MPFTLFVVSVVSELSLLSMLYDLEFCMSWAWTVRSPRLGQINWNLLSTLENIFIFTSPILQISKTAMLVVNPIFN